ncbi:hypothetical protein Pan44_02210 [Caulifigura coniformis]|uniref:Uncharacterized protein n=1 Tax=Caulifigura coniformis TaxID=2527983 RepID=A0A517S7W7_9PLAN|nr:hypothetical protein [Caulifigura coniformis]QDT52212.1 hypothetical protein Pan44_02210 [Caulifigura coniformis]
MSSTADIHAASPPRADGAAAGQPGLPTDTADRPLPWLFSPAIDLWTFGGSAALSFLLLAIGARLGLLESEAPEWTWITCVLLIDVAHVYATGFRVYFDRNELARRPGLYFGTPVACFAIGWAIYSESPEIYWRLLAYLAVFHFIRQQYGWVMLYRAKGGESGTWSRRFDAATISMATLHPLAVWHAHLPRSFRWMIEGDFAELPAWLPHLTGPVWGALLVTYFARSLWRGLQRGEWNPGKDLVVATTAACWYIGIVLFNSDYAFTVTNVVIHGIPYFVIVYFTWQGPKSVANAPARWRPLLLFFGALWALAFVEELLWDRGVWNDRGHLFGDGWRLPNPGELLVPLLGVPQLTHYVLDGFIWKRARNHAVAQTLQIDPPRGPSSR